MIDRVITQLDQWIGALKAPSDFLVPKNNVLVPRVLEMSIAGANIPMVGDLAGLVVNQFDEFPNPLRLTIRGKVMVGTLVAHPPAMNTLRVAIGFPRMDNPALSGPYSVSAPLEADGSFDISVPSLTFEGNEPSEPSPVVRLHGVATIEGSNVPVEDMPFVV